MFLIKQHTILAKLHLRQLSVIPKKKTLLTKDTWFKYAIKKTWNSWNKSLVMQECGWNNKCALDIFANIGPYLAKAFLTHRCSLKVIWKSSYYLA